MKPPRCATIRGSGRYPCEESNDVNSIPRKNRNRIPVEVRFWRLVKVGSPDECWPWQGTSVPRGYGQFTIDRFNKNRYSHRVAYQLTVGPIPDGLFILHKCDNPPCCNPAHLFPGTPLDNVKDMYQKGRAAVGDKNGARLHPERIARGEKKSKLKLEQVLEIRRLHGEGYSYPEISKKTGIRAGCVGKVARRELWKHIP